MHYVLAHFELDWDSHVVNVEHHWAEFWVLLEEVVGVFFPGLWGKGHEIFVGDGLAVSSHDISYNYNLSYS